MDEIIKTFLIMIAGMTNYAIPSDVPVVTQVPVSVLQDWACEGKKCPIGGWFPGGNTIYISDELNPETEAEARGILFHEVVHYIQYTESPTQWTENRTCEETLNKEMEAYRLQEQYMHQVEHVFKPHFGMRYRLQC